MNRLLTTFTLLTLASPIALAQRTVPNASAARQVDYFERASADVESISRDSKGRETLRTVQHWDKETVYQGKTVFATTFRADALVERKRTRFDALNHVQTIEITKYSQPKPRHPHVEVRLTTGDWRLLRTEVSDTEPSDDGSTLTTTVVRDGEGALLETRYIVSRMTPASAGRKASDAFHSSDMSVYDAAGVQRSRTLVEWRGNRMDRWTFNEEDEVREREMEHRTLDARKRISGVSSDTCDGAGTRISGREEQFTYGGPSDALSEHVTTWYDGQGTGTQRRTSQSMFKNGQPSGARVLWENWQAPIPE